MRLVHVVYQESKATGVNKETQATPEILEFKDEGGTLENLEERDWTEIRVNEGYQGRLEDWGSLDERVYKVSKASKDHRGRLAFPVNLDRQVYLEEVDLKATEDHKGQMDQEAKMVK